MTRASLTRQRVVRDGLLLAGIIFNLTLVVAWSADLLPIAAAVVLFAGRTDRAWLVPVGVVIAMPTIWLQSTAILTACFPLWAERARWRRLGGGVAVAEPVTGAAT